MSHFLLNTVTPFPVIETLAAFKEAVGSKEEIRYMEQSNNTTVACYLISMDSTFDNPNARECRGIVFNEDGNVIGRPLHKFFNVGEKPTTQISNLPWDTIVRVMDKRDGCLAAETLITTVDGKKTIKEICDTKYTGLVVGYNHTSNNFELTPVIGHSVKDNNNNWYELEIDNGIKIKLTGNHKVWVVNKKCYIAVEDLTIDDEVLSFE